MTVVDQASTAPSSVDGDGVRIIQRQPRWLALGREHLALALLLGGIGLLPLLRPETPPAPATVPVATPASAAQTPRTPPAPAPRAAAPASIAAVPMPSAAAATTATHDAAAAYETDDLAAYIRPGDPEPTMAELIDALRHAGIHDGLAAFNPPGTSPPLEGIAVPADVALPPGYVRHHQVSDQGEPIEPILMFSPDFEFLDGEGRPVELPANRVVPESMVPPGIPIRHVRLPTP